jgi:DNA topoisomerase-1
MNASYQVVDVQTKPTKKSPTAPFTTSTLQQEASRKLGYSVTRTMSVAQKLYENGHISYMRTDSVSLSETAIENIKDAVSNKYGANYFQRRKYANKNESAQEAHEAIRPTDMHTENVGDIDGQRLYELIWKRTMASQMADAEIDRTTAKIEISTNKALLTASGEVITFYGFLKAYQESTDEEEDDKDTNTSNLPPLKIAQQVEFKEMRAMQRFSRPPARYTEAALVKKLEELGIGRPSTYAPTIKTIVDRAYVEKGMQDSVVRNFEQLVLKNNQIQESVEKENTGGNKGKLIPTNLGLVVTQFLSEGFDKIMDYNFTAKIEQEFDEIALGKLEWEEMLHQFYKPFHATVDDAMAQQGRVTGERELGIDPNSGKLVIVRLGKYGAMVQMGIADDEEKPQFASLNPNQSIQTITLQEALDLFKLPMHVGKKEELDVIVHSGRFGPYISWGDLKVSLPKGLDPLTVDFEKALQLISEKQTADAPIATFDSKPVTKGSGRFGPFIKWNDMYINVPKRYDLENLSKSDIDALINAKMEKESKRYIQHWESEKIAIENGRWGPFIRFGKQMIKLDKAANGEKQTEALLQALSLEDVKKMIEEKIPNAFTKKASAKKAVAKKAVAKKATSKKTATKKAVVKKSAAAKK